MVLDFTFGLGLDVGKLPPDTDNEIDDDTRSITDKQVTTQGTEKQTEDAANNDDPRETEEAVYINEDNNQLDSTERIVQNIEPTG